MRRGLARPVGAGLSDYQGAAPDAEWNAREVVKACGLRAFAFDHLIASQAPFAPYVRLIETSPVVDLDRPWAGPGRADPKRRRLSRRAEVRLRLREPSGGALRTLLAWKSEQVPADRCVRPPRPAVGRGAARAAPRDEHRRARGALACLYADDVLVAAHFGLRSARVLHSSFPAYDPALARDSPGIVLLRMLLDAAPADGIGLFDLGKGAEPYKTAFANGAIDVAVGHVETDLRAGAARAVWRRLLNSPLRRPVRAVRSRLDFR